MKFSSTLLSLLLCRALAAQPECVADTSDDDRGGSCVAVDSKNNASDHAMLEGAESIEPDYDHEAYEEAIIGEDGMMRGEDFEGEVYEGEDLEGYNDEVYEGKVYEGDEYEGDDFEEGDFGEVYEGEEGEVHEGDVYEGDDYEGFNEEYFEGDFEDDMSEEERRELEEQENMYFEPIDVRDITDEMFSVYEEESSEGEGGHRMLWHQTPFGVDQSVDDNIKDKAVEVMAEIKKYMMETVLVDPEYEAVKDTCRLRNELCVFWAAEGECDENPGFMALHCAPACESCERLDVNGRCPWSRADYPDAWLAPDDEDVVNGRAATPREDQEVMVEDEIPVHNKTLNFMFERMTTDPWFVEQYKPTVLSSDPWAVTLDGFLSDEECDALIKLGADKGYERSQDVGDEKFDGTQTGTVSSDRTSYNTWCDYDCMESDVNKAVLARIQNLTMIPYGNYEYLQLLKYDVGEYYKQHHDYIHADANRQMGARILTVFLYLNDVPEGGGTKFPHLGPEGIVVAPERGRALLWPSVSADDPNEIDDRTEHEALPVTRGSKYAANAWVHQRDFLQAHNSGCD